jgi:preprotein translocase subunit YajC
MVDVASAQTAATAAAPAASNSPLAMVISFAPFIVIMILFYFLMIYPQNKERKKREEALNAIQRGDRILTRGGVYGTVADIKEQILIVKIAENVKVEMDRSFVESVIKG